MQIALVIFALFSLFWFLLQLFPPGSEFHSLFTHTYGLMAAWGGIQGLLVARKWGWSKSIMGRSILMFSFGLLAQEFGQIAYSAYSVVLKLEEVPYPSLGDIGYFGSILFYIYGIYLLAQAAGVTVGLKSFKNKIQAIIIPSVLLLCSYTLFLHDYSFDWSIPLTILLDFGYPLGQAIYISLAILTFLLSRGILGGVMKIKVLYILLALVMQYLADYVFLYQASRGTWYPGNFNEFMYLVSYFLMTVSIIQLNTVLTRIKNG